MKIVNLESGKVPDSFFTMKTLILRIVFILLVLMVLPVEITASDYASEADSLRFAAILNTPGLNQLPNGQRNVVLAESFLEANSASTPELTADSTGTVTMRAMEFDALQFVNTVLALNATVHNNNSEINSLPKNYADFARRKGKASQDWLSHFLFPSDWLNDNLFRRNLKEVTGDFGQILHDTSRTIDYISRHRQEYPQLKDSTLYDRVRHMEMGYVQHPVRFLPINSFTKQPVKKGLEEGDIVVVYSNEPDYDSRDIGFVTKEGEDALIIHVSEAEGKVVREKLPLDKYLKLNVKRVKGVRVFRNL